MVAGTPPPRGGGGPTPRAGAAGPPPPARARGGCRRWPCPADLGEVVKVLAGHQGCRGHALVGPVGQQELRPAPVVEDERHVREVQRLQQLPHQSRHTAVRHQVRPRHRTAMTAQRQCRRDAPDVRGHPRDHAVPEAARHGDPVQEHQDRAVAARVGILDLTGRQARCGHRVLHVLIDWLLPGTVDQATSHPRGSSLAHPAPMSTMAAPSCPSRPRTHETPSAASLLARGGLMWWAILGLNQ